MTATRNTPPPRSPRTPTGKVNTARSSTEQDGVPSGTGNGHSGKTTPQGALSPSLFDSLQQRASKLKVLLGSLSNGSRAAGGGPADNVPQPQASARAAAQVTDSTDKEPAALVHPSSAPAKTATGSKQDSLLQHHPGSAPAIAASGPAPAGAASRARAGSWSSGTRGGDAAPSLHRAQGTSQAKAQGKVKEGASSLILRDAVADKSRAGGADPSQAAPRPPQLRPAPAAATQVGGRDAIVVRRSASDGGAAAAGADGRSPGFRPPDPRVTANPISGGAAGDHQQPASGLSGAALRAPQRPHPLAAPAGQPTPSYAALAAASMKPRRSAGGGSSDGGDQRSAHAPPLPPPPPLPTQPPHARPSRSPSPTPGCGGNDPGAEAAATMSRPRPQAQLPRQVGHPPPAASVALTPLAQLPSSQGAPATTCQPAAGAQPRMEGNVAPNQHTKLESQLQRMLQAETYPASAVATAAQSAPPRSHAAEELSAILSNLAVVAAPPAPFTMSQLGASPGLDPDPDSSSLDLEPPEVFCYGGGPRRATGGSDVAAAVAVAGAHQKQHYGAEGPVTYGFSGAVEPRPEGVGTDAGAAGEPPADSEAALAQALAVARASALAAFLRPEARVYRPNRNNGFKTTNGSAGGSSCSSPVAPSAGVALGIPALDGSGKGHGQGQVFAGVSAFAAPFCGPSTGGIDTVGTGPGGSPRCCGASSGVDSRTHSPGAHSPGAQNSRYEKLLKLQEADGAVGGGGGRRRVSGPPDPEFLRRNAVLLRKRQTWAEASRECEGSPGSPVHEQPPAQRRRASRGPDEEDEPVAAAGLRRASSAGRQQPQRSLLDLQRWADRREQRLAVLREEREAEERARAESQLTFKPTIGERSRRLAKLARSRPSYRPLPGCSPPPRSPTLPPASSAAAAGGSGGGSSVATAPRASLRASGSAARARSSVAGRSSIGGASAVSTLGTGSASLSQTELLTAMRGRGRDRPLEQQQQQQDPASSAKTLPRGGVIGGAAAAAGSSGGGSSVRGMGVRSRSVSVAAQLAAARSSRARGRYATTTIALTAGGYDDPVVGAVADAIKSATAALKLRPAPSRRAAAPAAQQAASDAPAATELRPRPRARMRLALSQSTQSLQQQLPQASAGRALRVSVSGSQASRTGGGGGGGSPRRRRRGSGAVGAGHEDPHSAHAAELLLLQQRRRESSCASPLASRPMDLWESPQPHSPNAYAHGGSRRPSRPASPLSSAPLTSTRAAVMAAAVASPTAAAMAFGVASAATHSCFEVTPGQAVGDGAGLGARRTIDLLGSGGAAGSGGLAIRTGRSPVLTGGSGSVKGFGSEMSGSAGAEHGLRNVRFSISNDGSPLLPSGGGGIRTAGSPVFLMLGPVSGGGAAAGSPAEATTAAAAVATTTMMGPGGLMIQIPQLVRLSPSGHELDMGGLAAAAGGCSLIAAPTAAGGLAVGAFRYGNLTSSPASTYVTMPYDTGNAILLPAPASPLFTAQAAGNAGAPAGTVPDLVTHTLSAPAAVITTTAAADAPPASGRSPRLAADGLPFVAPSASPASQPSEKTAAASSGIKSIAPSSGGSAVAAFNHDILVAGGGHSNGSFHTVTSDDMRRDAPAVGVSVAAASAALGRGSLGNGVPVLPLPPAAAGLGREGSSVQLHSARDAAGMTTAREIPAAMAAVLQPRGPCMNGAAPPERAAHPNLVSAPSSSAAQPAVASLAAAGTSTGASGPSEPPPAGADTSTRPGATSSASSPLPRSSPGRQHLAGVRFTKILAQQFAAGLLSANAPACHSSGGGGDGGGGLGGQPLRATASDGGAAPCHGGDRRRVHSRPASAPSGGWPWGPHHRGGLVVAADGGGMAAAGWKPLHRPGLGTKAEPYRAAETAATSGDDAAALKTGDSRPATDAKSSAASAAATIAASTAPSPMADKVAAALAAGDDAHGHVAHDCDEYVRAADPLTALQSLIMRMKHLGDDDETVCSSYGASRGGSSIGRGSSAGGSALDSSGGGAGAPSLNSSAGGSAANGRCKTSATADGGADCAAASVAVTAAGDPSPLGTTAVVSPRCATGHAPLPPYSAACGSEAAAGPPAQSATSASVLNTACPPASAAAAVVSSTGPQRPAGDVSGGGQQHKIRDAGLSLAESLPLEVLVQRAEQLRASVMSAAAAAAISRGSSPRTASPTGSWATCAASQRVSSSPLAPQRALGGSPFMPISQVNFRGGADAGASAASSVRRSGYSSVSSGSGASVSPGRPRGGGGGSVMTTTGSGARPSTEFMFPQLTTDASASGATAAAIAGIRALQLAPLAEWPGPAPATAAAQQAAVASSGRREEEELHEISLAGGLEQPPGARQAPRRVMPPALASVAEELAAAAALQPRYTVWSLSDHLPAAAAAAAGANATNANIAVHSGGGNAAAAPFGLPQPTQANPAAEATAGVPPAGTDQDPGSGSGDAAAAPQSGRASVGGSSAELVAPSAREAGEICRRDSLTTLQSLIRQMADL